MFDFPLTVGQFWPIRACECKFSHPLNGSDTNIWLTKLSCELNETTQKKYLAEDPVWNKWSNMLMLAEAIVMGFEWLYNGHEFEQALGNGEGQGSLACCSPWGRKESDMIERLNNNDNNTSSYWVYPDCKILTILYISKQSIMNSLEEGQK